MPSVTRPNALRFKNFLALTAFGVIVTAISWADCTTPAAKAGEVIFNTTTKTMQYCNGTNWVNTGVSVPAAAQTGCTGPAAQPGSVIYNNTASLIQFCNGENWVDTACASTRTPGGSGCSGGKTGDMRYETTSNELQFCDSTNWTAMGWPCGSVTVSLPAINVGDVFSYDLYTGTGGNLPIVNGLDMSGQGGMVLTKARSTAYGWLWFDTTVPFGYYFFPFDTSARGGSLGYTTGSFNNNGFTAVAGNNPSLNGSGIAFGAYSWRKSPRFFDMVTYTGNGTARVINHNLSVKPGMVIIKPTGGGDWYVWHRGAPTQYFTLNTTIGGTADGTGDGSTASEKFSENFMTTTTIGLGGASSINNTSGASYIAYIFAHDPSPDGVSQCGSYTGTGSNLTVTLGWEPQYVMIRRSDNTSNWYFLPSNGTVNNSGNESFLSLPGINSETNADLLDTNSTGFIVKPYSSEINGSGGTYIYCAIRKE